MNTQCPGCQRNLPIHNGIHTGEVEMIRCTAFSAFDLEPKSRDSWFEDRPRNEAWFRFGGGV